MGKGENPSTEHFRISHNVFCHICSTKCKRWDDSGIVLRKVGIPTLSSNSGIIRDNSCIAQGTSIVLWSGMVCVQSRNMYGQSKN